MVWAWNSTYLPAPRARVAGDRVSERDPVKDSGAYDLTRNAKILTVAWDVLF
jgi:hypothetical protein